MRLAREYEAERGRDLRGFIDFVDERELLAAREGEAPLEGEGLDAVRLMTVHAAKGLEFPVVCVADLGREGRGDDGALQVSPDGRVGLQVASLGGGSHGAMDMDAIKAEQEELAEQEERRIFYVAMTRAQSRLIVSGAVDASKWDAPKPLGTPMDWVWPALAPGAKLLFESVAKGIDGGVRCVMLSADTADQVLPAGDRAPERSQPRPTSLDIERPVFASLADGVRLPVARLSYSGLESYKRCGYRFYLERVVKMRSGAKLATEASVEDGDQLALTAAAVAPAEMSPLLRGTIVHELLERIDFRRPRAPSSEEIERQARANGTSVSEHEVGEIASMIDGFLGSDLFARIDAAQRVRQELPFAYPLEPDGLGGRSLLVNGVVDVHADLGDRLLVVDYKTDALEGRDPEEVCDEKYAGQRLVYALAGLRSDASEVEVAYCFLERPDLVVSRRFSSGERERLEAELLDLAGGVISGSFVPAAEPHRELCQSCPGQPALCSWPSDRTLAERPQGETFAAPEPERQLS
jgi:ATP-dependent exoDNAse (exonuclease V) beta subunit